MKRKTAGKLPRCRALRFELLEELELLADLSIVPLFDGETVDRFDGSDNRLLNRMGGKPFASDDLAIEHSTATVLSGTGAFRLSTDGIASGGLGFVIMSVGGRSTDPNYVDTRDLSRFDELDFWVLNSTGSAFSMVLELKDYRDSNDHRLRWSHIVPAGPEWEKIAAPLDELSGWIVDGAPDLSRARQIGLLIEADQGQGVAGDIFLDDMCLIELGGSLDPATAPLGDLAGRLARRSFDMLWGTRDRVTGLLPNVADNAQTVALNVTAGMVKLLPTAISQGWISSDVANAYVDQLTGTLNTAMDVARESPEDALLPPRFLDRVTLEPPADGEESPIDAAFMYLSLYQYSSSTPIPQSLRTKVESLLGRFNFAAFSKTEVEHPGWSQAFQYSTGLFTDQIYDGYSGEIWLISLAAHLSKTHHVDIVTHYHSAWMRKSEFLIDETKPYLVHPMEAFRAPFLQWLFPLFVDVSDRWVDTYPDPLFRTNPLRNAENYQIDVDAQLASLGRPLLLQPDAARSRATEQYQQFSVWADFDEPDLLMPWSTTLALLGDPDAAEPALRNVLSRKLYGPLGLSDSVVWETGEPVPARVAAWSDLWNVSLATMALVQYLHGVNELLALEPNVREALDKVFIDQDKPWNNPRHNVDINDDRHVFPLDVLTIINDLITNGQRMLPGSDPPPAPQPYLDANGDNLISALDAHAVIDWLIENPPGTPPQSGLTMAASAHGESEAVAAPSSPGSTLSFALTLPDDRSTTPAMQSGETASHCPVVLPGEGGEPTRASASHVWSAERICAADCVFVDHNDLFESLSELASCVKRTHGVWQAILVASGRFGA